MSRILRCMGVTVFSTVFIVGCASDKIGTTQPTADSGTSSPSMLPAMIDVPASEGRFETTVAKDLDPAADVVEVALEAKIADVELAPGRRVSMWTYNGVLPGPRIDVRAGNKLRVRFKNSLPEATTIHWHGVRVPAAMDGVEAMQSPVAAGEMFTYEFTVPDAGVFWYHPHVRSDEQVERGLYGSIVVRGANEPTTTTDRVVVLDDVLVDRTTWKLAAFDPMTQAMVGRQGNLILVNGRAHPIAPMQRGGLHRFRFINAANARYFRLSWPGHKLIQIGTDGGFLTAPQQHDELLLVPGERADVLVVATGDAGVATEWKSLRYERGHETGHAPDAEVFQSKNTADAAVSTPPVPTALATIAALPSATVQRVVKLEESMGGGGGAHTGHGGHGSTTTTTTTMGPVFSMNGKVFPDGERFNAQLGAVEQWSIENATEMDHPFHLHGFRFQIMSASGQPFPYIAWRDTINVPAKKSVLIRMRLEDHPGTWMFHCHILEHAERGMMGELHVAARAPK